MKRNIVFFTAILAVLYVVLSSDIDGPAHHGHGNITGSTSGATGHCQTSSCHGGNNALTIANLEVSDTTTMLPITHYNALQTYLVTLTGNDTAVTASLPGFGFQVSAVLGSHAQGGTFSIPSSLSSKIHTYNCGTTTVVEHSVTLAPIATGVKKYSIQFYWTAPAAGSDSISFYSLLNAVNGDGGSSGDYPNAAPIVTIYENPTTSVSGVAPITNSDFYIYPNPSTGNATISYELVSEEEVSLVVYDLGGKIVSVISELATQKAGIHNAQPGKLAPGIYIVRMSAGHGAVIHQFIQL